MKIRIETQRIKLHRKNLGMVQFLFHVWTNKGQKKPDLYSRTYKMPARLQEIKEIQKISKDSIREMLLSQKELETSS